MSVYLPDPLSVSIVNHPTCHSDGHKFASWPAAASTEYFQARTTIECNSCSRHEPPYFRNSAMKPSSPDARRFCICPTHVSTSSLVGRVSNHRACSSTLNVCPHPVRYLSNPSLDRRKVCLPCLPPVPLQGLAARLWNHPLALISCVPPEVCVSGTAHPSFDPSLPAKPASPVVTSSLLPIH